MLRYMSLRNREALTGVIFALPWLLGFCIFRVYAIITVIYYSLTDFKVFAPPEWIGLVNYQELFRSDPLFYRSLSNTFYYVAFSIPLGIIVAFLLAELLNQKVKGMALFRTIFYLPSIVPIVASSMLWLWILNPNFGLLNAFLSKLGLPAPNWFGSPVWSKPALILMSIWGIGGTMIIFLAGLQDIPQQLYEAAELDGAGVFQKFFRITIPMMTPTLFFSLVMGIIGGFQTFTQAFIMTQGGPAYSTLFYALYLYNNAFRYFKMGYASSQALVLLVIIMILTLTVVSTSKRWVYYAGRS
ncbi:MAG: sugar ABC transporter permease [Firmicutes bacterium]|nr:sugar ABC transporter permease [Bacillota bacterium]